MAQSGKRPTWAQVMISQFMGSRPTSGSVLRAQSLEPATDSVSPSLSLLLSHSTLHVSLSQKKKLTLKKIFLNKCNGERPALKHCDVFST